MFCTKCGLQVQDNTRFCPQCGSQLSSGGGQASGGVRTDGQTKRAGRRRRIPTAAIVIPLAAVILAVAFCGYWFIYRDYQDRRLVEDAAQYAASGNYADAIASYETAMERGSEDSGVVLALADAYIRQGDYKKADRLLSGVNSFAGSGERDQYRTMERFLSMTDADIVVDAAGYPGITLAVDAGDAETLSVTGLTENGEERDIIETWLENGVYYISYETELAEEADEQRDITLALNAEGYDLSYDAGYLTPELKDAVMTLISTDITDYPIVKLYYRVEDPLTDEIVRGLTDSSFIIRERISGGEYLSREIHSVELLEGNRGLNMSLVADKSDSISYSDMAKIKQVMTSFVESLDYEAGDKAEVLAFDSIVQQMCSFTDNVQLLKNGISNMSTDGMTALYDALWDGINHAALRGGARCVVAFTDGMDNRSYYAPYEVIDYALAKQVPVYIIGVGSSVEASVLRNIAESTGGRYWYIDNLSDMSEIFEIIYVQQKEMYVVEYESDDESAARTVEVSMKGGGYEAGTEDTFTPVKSLGDATHTSRYEAFLENVTWQQAYQRCEEMGGHLATITSSSEQNEIIELAERNGIKYIWLGGYTSYDDDGNVFGHWITGEDFEFSNWMANEPSRVDLDGTEEWYIMLWYVNNNWTWNDQRNDPVSEVSSMGKSIGFICEFEE